MFGKDVRGRNANPSNDYETNEIGVSMGGPSISRNGMSHKSVHTSDEECSSRVRKYLIKLPNNLLCYLLLKLGIVLWKTS